MPDVQQRCVVQHIENKRYGCSTGDLRLVRRIGGRWPTAHYFPDPAEIDRIALVILHVHLFAEKDVVSRKPGSSRYHPRLRAFMRCCFNLPEVDALFARARDYAQTERWTLTPSATQRLTQPKSEFLSARGRCWRAWPMGTLIQCAQRWQKPSRTANSPAPTTGLVSARAQERLGRLGTVENPTQAQKRKISREEARKTQADWLLDFGSPGSPFFGVDEEYYLSLVEWTGRRLRKDKRGYLPANLQTVLDQFELDAKAWANNVKSYGSLFDRTAGKAEQLLDFAKSRGRRWFRGRDGSESLYLSDRNHVSRRPKSA